MKYDVLFPSAILGTTRAAVLSLMWLSVCTAQGHPVATEEWRYTIRPGDTVFGLTQEHLKPSVSWQALANYNGLTNPQIILPGKKLRVPLRWLALRKAQVSLTAVSGDVQVQGDDSVWQVAKKGQMLQAGQRIQVGRNSSARLQFADDSELILQPQTSIVLDTLSVYAGGYMADTGVRLQAGRVELHVNPKSRKRQKFDLSTPAAVASVRGTQFVVEAEAGRTIQQTTQGQVILQTYKGAVVVPEGYGSSARLGEKPQAIETIKHPPTLQSPIARFTDFPIEFTWAVQPDISGWVMQVGRDSQMAQLELTLQSHEPYLNASGLPDGSYYLRAWSLDAQGVPSKAALHTFEVRIPRRLQGPAVLLPAHYFAAGPIDLQLAPLPEGQRYLVQVTQDAEGRLPVWQMVTASGALSLPVPTERNHTHHLWVWAY